jgi:DNA repair protein RecO (recombination protein O)
MGVDRVALQPCYVLHRRAYGETSLLVEAFTADHGRVGLLAKGAKRGGRWQGLLQPFQPLLLSWSGRGELRTLTGAEARGFPPPLTGRLLFSGFYLNELLLKLLQREDPHPELFASYGEALAGLAADEAWTLRRFECDLLRGLGYGLTLEHDAAGDPLRPEGLYHYEVEQGPVPMSEATTGNRSSHIHGRSLLALAGAVEPDATARQETKRLLRAVLALHLDGRPLESRALYRSAAEHDALGEGGDEKE